VLIIAAVIGLVQIAVPIALKSSFPQQAKEWASSFLSFSSFLVIIVGTFFAGDAIASEFEQKTGYIIFANPVKRASLVAGKFAAALISALLTIGFYYLIGTGAMIGIYRSVPVETAASFAYATLYLCCVLGFTFLFSALLKGSMGATLLSFFTFFLILSIVSEVISLVGVEPWFLPNYASGMITQVINPQKDTVITVPNSSLKIYTFYPKYPISIIVLVLYFTATLALAIMITRRKQMP
jgi:ABC-type transport system involved in multi-copper enzyme maturation permease subunit